MRTIDADALYTLFVKMKSFGELTAKKAIRCVEEAPTVEAIPIEFVKGELKHLKYMLLTADSDDVDSIWDLKAKIEALEDLLKEWEERKE